MFKKAINEIIENGKKNIQINEGDYQKDGLWYCGKCHTKKQTEINLFDTVMKPMCLCKCEAEKRDRERAEFERVQRQYRIEEMRKTGFPDSEMKNWTFAKDDLQNEKVTQVAKNYVENFEEMGK